MKRRKVENPTDTVYQETSADGAHIADSLERAVELGREGLRCLAGQETRQ